MRTIGLCCPTYNRYEFTKRMVDNVINDNRIEQVYIQDDCSTDGSYEQLCKYYGGNTKVNIGRNEQNRDCAFNKATVVSKSKEEYVCLIDSDNIIGEDYLNAIFKEEWEPDTILAPVWAKPSFDYREYSGVTITKENINQYLWQPMFMTALNTMNFFVNRNRFVIVFDWQFNPHNCDSIYFNYCWLKNGGKIKFVEGMQYYHEIHQQSHYVQNIPVSHGIHDIIVNKIMELK